MAEKSGSYRLGIYSCVQCNTSSFTKSSSFECAGKTICHLVTQIINTANSLLLMHHIFYCIMHLSMRCPTPHLGRCGDKVGICHSQSDLPPHMEHLLQSQPPTVPRICPTPTADFCEDYNVAVTVVHFYACARLTNTPPIPPLGTSPRVNSPIFPHYTPEVGVVGHRIDRCISHTNTTKMGLKITKNSARTDFLYMYKHVYR